ncbi:MAG: CDGSH iron-sulfur domain-containing protein [Magnetococcus sp. DMHC-1]|nr:CDGSH iron-sulfur domain-containing protein [Magnetococcales bacterium]MBF0155139.1 CDGSH iron-sulfur domain-containing protein [Magnetococcales bacterium]
MTDMFKKGEPYLIKAKPGETYAICTCGHTQDPPFCDGAHKQHPPKKPHLHKVQQVEDLYACGCGGSKSAPWCDGTHKSCPEHDNYMKRW